MSTNLENAERADMTMTPHAYAQEYEFRGDTDYTPSDFERTMIEDAILGYLGEARIRSCLIDKPEAGEAVSVSGITLRTINHRDYGQDIAVYATGIDGREVEVIRSFGALPDITIDHHITNHGLAGLLPALTQEPTHE